MKIVQLATYPASLPSHVEVRDVDMEDGTFFRVVMELDTAVKIGHLQISAQAFEMNADGTFKQAPNGYPSRSGGSIHTIPADALNDTVCMDDDWVRHTPVSAETLDPVALGLDVVEGRPTVSGTEYGQLVWDSARQHAWRWAEGFADSTARAKLQDVARVVRSSNVLSGFGFR